MERFEINSKLEKTDSRRLILYSFFGRKAAYAASMAVFPLFFLILPTYFFLLGLVRLNFSLLFTFYVISAWAYTYFTVKSVSNEYRGVSRYIFHSGGIQIMTEKGFTLLTPEQVYSCEESKYFFLITTRQNEAFAITKRFLTPQDGENIRAHFGQALIKKTRTPEEGFSGESCGELELNIGKALSSTEITVDDNFFKESAGFRLTEPATVSRCLFMIFLLTGCCGLLLGTPIALIIGAILGFIAFFNTRLMLIKLMKNRAESSGGTIRVGIFENHAEFTFAGRNNRVFFSEIKAVKKGNYSVKLKTGRGAFIMPVCYELEKALEGIKK